MELATWDFKPLSTSQSERLILTELKKKKKKTIKRFFKKSQKANSFMREKPHDLVLKKIKA